MASLSTGPTPQNAPPNATPNNRRRLAAEAALVLLVGVGLFSTAAHFDLPMQAAWGVIALIAWTLWRLTNASRWGIRLWAIGATAISLAWRWDLSLAQDSSGLLLKLPNIVGLLSLFVAGIIFFCALFEFRASVPENCFGVTLAFFSLFTLFSATSSANAIVNAQKNENATTQSLILLHKLGEEVEAIRAKRGSVPIDEEEFVRLRGEPLPIYRYTHRITYQRRNGNEYELELLMPDFWGGSWDFFGYIIRYAGPRNPQRIQSTLF